VPRFVILEHDHPHLHWDLMLESGAVLRAWRLSAPPRTGQPVRAEPIGDHRCAYLDYEGPVSGGRGSVTRWDAGVFSWDESGADRLTVVLEGNRCRGLALLQRSDAGEWSLMLQACS
jgi:DNA polymerase Ligase (LigD)